jgi:hypothetical protein
MAKNMDFQFMTQVAMTNMPTFASSGSMEVMGSCAMV